MFLDSDTDMMVLSFVPSRRDSEPLTIQAADAVRRIVDRMEGTHRLLIHGRVNPNQPGDLEAMDELKERWKVSAWKTYTQWGVGRQGFLPVRRRRHALHREGARARRQGDLRAQGPAVRQAVLRAQPVQRHRRRREALSRREFPRLSLGFRDRRPGARLHRARRGDGIDTLIRSLVENERQTQQQRLRRARQHLALPDARPRRRGACARQAAQVLRREQRALGHRLDLVRLAAGPDPGVSHFPDRAELRAKHGYPEITPALRAKIFGLNATRPYAISADEVKKHAAAIMIARERLAYRERPEPHYLTYGPKTRREFLNLLRWNGGSRA